MRNGIVIFLVGICACLLSGCGIDSAMEDLARQQIASSQSVSETSLPEEDVAETEPTEMVTAAPTPVETPETFYNSGITSEQESDSDSYEWDQEYDDTEELEEDDWYEADTDYIFPYSDVEKLTKADLEGLTAEELRLGRNEIYARHGRIFDDQELQAYFNGKSWYFGSIAPSEFVDSLELNDIERWNANFIRKHE